MAADLVIRTASPEDAELLAAIHRECFPHYWDSSAFTNFFGVAGTMALIAQAPLPVGMIVYRLHGEEAEILTLAINPAWRRQGIARALLEKALADALSLGVRRLFLDVEEGNTAALGLYQGYEFTQINRRKLYYKQKDGSFTDALVMRRML